MCQWMWFIAQRLSADKSFSIFVPSTECCQQERPTPKKKPCLCWDWDLNEHLDLSPRFSLQKTRHPRVSALTHMHTFLNVLHFNNFRSDQYVLSLLVGANARFGSCAETSFDYYLNLGLEFVFQNCKVCFRVANSDSV